MKKYTIKVITWKPTLVEMVIEAPNQLMAIATGRACAAGIAAGKKPNEDIKVNKIKEQFGPNKSPLLSCLRWR